MNIILAIIVAVLFVLFTLGAIGGLIEMNQRTFYPADYAGLIILVVLALLFGMLLFTGSITIY